MTSQDAVVRKLEPFEIFKDHPDGPEMVVLPAGRYFMGAYNGLTNEVPVHLVTIDRPFAMSRTQTTFDHWDAFHAMGGTDYCPDERPRFEEYPKPSSTTPPGPRWERGKRPVINVSWFDAVSFADWLAEETGFDYRLPSEAEWEYACRAGTMGDFSWGDADPRGRANGAGLDDEYSNVSTTPVGSYPANPFGLYDMHGNVWEWVADSRNDDTYSGGPVDQRARVDQANAFRILRGGSWRSKLLELRSAARKYSSGGFRYNGGSLGFRVARSLTPIELGEGLLDLTAPIPKRDLVYYASAFEKTQGNILKSSGREHSRYVTIRFGTKKATARRWIGELGRNSTSVAKQMQMTQRWRDGDEAGLFASVMLSADGYRHLELPLNGHDAVFKAGMKSRGSVIFDPPVEHWEEPYQSAIHALVYLADNRAATLDAVVESLSDTLEDVGEILACEKGWIARSDDGREIEHFGFADGISNPRFFESDMDARPDGTSVWNPATPPSVALVKDPNGSSSDALGSYFVFRKLEQDIKGFREAENKLAEAVPAADPDWLSAQIVGRFRDGTPLPIQNASGAVHPVPNNFDFRGDPRGERCPFHSHIRKMNPRGEHMPLADELQIQIIRRGASYGDWDGAAGITRTPIEELPSKGNGLLFACYQANLLRQFEFLQRDYANDGDFLYGYEPGLDPIAGQGVTDGSQMSYDRTKLVPIGQRWLPYPKAPRAEHVPFSFHSFVTMKGGEYFFAPSLDFFELLATGEKPSAKEVAAHDARPAASGTMKKFGERVGKILRTALAS